MAAEDQALADLQSAVTDVGTAIALEITALQNAMNAQGVNNSPAIEASVTKIRSLIGSLNVSLQPPVVTPPLPTVASISPATGPAAGGTTVNLTGTGLTGASGVTVGGIPATSLSGISATGVTFVTPASVVGPAAVVVTTPNGISGGATVFTYV